MTREEAIRRFENVKANALIQKANGVSEYWQGEIDGTVEALDMAIEALSAEYEDYEHATLVDIKEPLKVSVVRCKDCIQMHIGGNVTHYYWCDLWDREVDCNNFCSWAERKGGDTE